MQNENEICNIEGCENLSNGRLICFDYGDDEPDVFYDCCNECADAHANGDWDTPHQPR